MKTVFIVLIAALAIQVCTSANVIDAEHKLGELREVVNRKVNEILAEQKKLSAEIDETSQQTKQRGLEDIQKQTERFEERLRAKGLSYRCRGARTDLYEELKKEHSNELIRCVHQQGHESVNLLSTQRLALVEYVQSAVYEEERHIVACGRHHECLNAAIRDIKNKIYEIGQLVNEEIGISRQTKETRENAIKACGSKVTANVENALGRVPTCTF